MGHRQGEIESCSLSYNALPVLCDGTPNSATYQILIYSIIDSYEITCRKSPKPGGVSGTLATLVKANKIFINRVLRAISRFSFQDSVDADAFHRGG
jgi:hypothetical protein